jgi:predicted MFS family arabinose efflux permease
MMIFVFPFLILGNIACTVVSSPYTLIALRALCGIGFAFLKYWLNSIVAAASNDDNFSANCGMMNAGLLGGITVGASLGSIFAQAMGYQSNYLFTAVIFGFILLWVIPTMPWKVIAKGHESAPSTEKTAVEKNKSNILKNPRQFLTLLFGCIPLNIGLMYVVAFVPSYMSNAGHSAVVTSYVYLVNGLAGIYIGMLILRFLKKKSLFVSASIALFLAAGGMLILLVNNSIAIIMISAGVLGLFDGFGTPSITSYFTSLTPKKSEVAGMMTTFNIVGSAVQIACPTLYNLLIQPDGKVTNLMIFGIAYIVVAVLFVIMCRPDKKKQSAEA